MDETYTEPDLVNHTRAVKIVEQILESLQLSPILDDPYLLMNKPSMSNRHKLIRYKSNLDVTVIVHFVMCDSNWSHFFIDVSVA